MRRGPGAPEDAKNVGLIAVSALAAMVATAGFLTVRDAPSHIHVRHVDASPDYRMMEPLSGTNRIYGTVHTRTGAPVTGFLRWDRNEGSWTDLLDANKYVDGSSSFVSGIRFGHIQSIRPLGRHNALFTLRSGQEVGMTSENSDLGAALRALTVTGPTGTLAEFEWQDIESVEFERAPRRESPDNNRLHGTLTTRSGLALTGYITWDVDEIYSTDELDGDADGREYEIPFGAIRSISRRGAMSARVGLHSGEELVLSGSKDVNRRNGGISVSDPDLGQVKVPWDEFDNVAFHGTADEARLDHFDGGHPIEGTVVTESGDELSGTIRWDQDETHSWEMLNGQAGRADFRVEFGQIARIEKASRGSHVTLKDGRTFDLSGSNDVNRENRGIVVESGGQSYTVTWDDFRELRLDR